MNSIVYIFLNAFLSKQRLNAKYELDTSVEIEYYQLFKKYKFYHSKLSLTFVNWRLGSF